jgi:tetratricopeptide (TPR) repeat protein
VRGNVYSELEHYEEALVDLNRAVGLEPQDAQYLIGRALTYMSMGRYEEASEDFDHGMMLNNTRWQAYNNSWGLVLSYLGRYAESIECYTRALMGDPGSAYILYNIAVVQARWKGVVDAKEHIDAARNAFKAMKVDFPGVSGHVLYGLGGLEALLGNTNRALEHLEQAILLSEEPIDWARSDIAWLDLRSNPRFQSLISKKASSTPADVSAQNSGG